jgi:urease accessory protein
MAAMDWATLRGSAHARVRAAYTALAFCTPLALASRALAHHNMGGRLPATFAEGLMSGLAHPVIGLDHLCAVLALGVVAAVLPAGFALPSAFVLATVLGTGWHMLGMGLPAAELMVALSVSVFGALLLLAQAIERSRASLAVVAAMLLAGAAHGYAYGESIVGAEPAPLGAYLLGFIGVQLAIARGAFAAAQAFFARRSAPQKKRALQLAGGAFVLAGALIAVLPPGPQPHAPISHAASAVPSAH